MFYICLYKFKITFFDNRIYLGFNFRLKYKLEIEIVKRFILRLVYICILEMFRGI